jgi:hypothetical protein
MHSGLQDAFRLVLRRVENNMKNVKVDDASLQRKGSGHTVIIV